MNKKEQLQAPVQFTDDELAEINTINGAGYGIDTELAEEVNCQLNKENENQL
jgi:hypothetical protein